MSRKTQRLNGLNPLSYLGFDAQQPTDIKLNNRDPLTSDLRNVYIGTWWLNMVTYELFYLAALSNGEATWISVSSTVAGILTLTADAGGPVSPDSNGNINIVGDLTTVVVTGDVLSNTLTVSAQDSTVLSSLTGDTGGPVMPTAGNINVVGTGVISIAGNPGTSTLTISQAGTVAASFPTQAGTATPVSGVLNIIGSGGLSTIGSGNTVTVAGGSTLATSFKTSPVTGTAVPAAGVLTFASGTNETISAAGSTVTFTGSGGGGGIPSYSTGSFIPVANATGGFTLPTSFISVGTYTQIGDIVFVKIYMHWGYNGGVGQIFISGLPFTVSPVYSDNLTTSFFHIIRATNIGWFSPIGTNPVIMFGKFKPSTDAIYCYISFGTNAVIPLDPSGASPQNTLIWGLSGWYYK